MSLNFYIILLSFGCLISSCSQCNSETLSAEKSEKEKRVIIQEIEAMGTALVEKNYDLFIDYNVPMIIESIGGQKKMLEYLLMMEENLKETGSEIKKIVVNDVPIIVRRNGEFQSIIKQNLVVEKKGEEDKISSQKMLGITSKGGRKWQFMDISKKKFDEVKLLIPDLDSRLEGYF